MHDTIYPHLNAVVARPDLQRLYTPTEAECDVATAETRDATAYLGFLLALKTFQRLGYFVRLSTIPGCIIRHIAEQVDCVAQIPDLAAYDQSGTSRRHHARIRALRGVKPFPAGGMPIIEQAMAAAARQTEPLADLINAAIDALLRQSYELPGFTTLVKVAQRQRTRIAMLFYQQVTTDLSPEQSTRLDALFVVDPVTERTPWDRLKDPTGKPTRANLAGIATHLEWFGPYQPLMRRVIAIPESKRRHFATEALAYDRATMIAIKPSRRYTLACALLASQYADTLDDVATMFIKRVRAIQHAAHAAWHQYQQQQQARTDALIATLREIVAGYQQDGSREERCAAIDTILNGTSDTVLQECDAHLTDVGNHVAPFVWPCYRSHRATLFRLLTLIPFCAGSQQTTLVDAITFLCAHAHHTGDWLMVRQGETPLLDLTWIPVGWWRVVTALPTRSDVPQRVNRRHFEACLMTQILSALHAGDLYLVGAERFGDPFVRVCSWDEYHARIAAYATPMGIAVDPGTFVRTQQEWLATMAATTDSTFPDNDQVTLVAGRPHIRRPQRAPDPPGLAELQRQVDARSHPHSILDALADTSHWLDWTASFGPLSGLERKLDAPRERYLATVFCYGCQLGPSATARAIGTLDRRQLTRIDQYHISDDQLDHAIQCFINAYQRCALPQVWGTADHASIDGTKWELYEQNLVSEQHIRYGGYGGIALYLLSSTYIALMSNFIACGAWEGHYLLDLLEQNHANLQPTVIHSDTQGQNEAIFGLAFLRGIELMPRIRNWRDLIFYRPSAHASYVHIDAVFSQKVIDWDLIRTHHPDMLRMALSIKEGRIAPSTILRTISAGKSKLAQAYRELGRVRRTGFLLRIMADADLRMLVHKETNKSESFNRFVKWLGFGSAGVIRENERPAQKKAIKYTLLIANAMIFHTTVTLANDLRALIREGYHVDAACVAALSPYATKHLDRFGTYTLNLGNPPEAVDYETPVVSPPAPPGEPPSPNEPATPTD